MNCTWVIGHRGAMAYAPENTAASFKAAHRLGADAVECDVHLSKDLHPIVIHDPTLDRTTSGKGRVGSMAWRGLARLDAGSWFSPRFRRQRLWRLSDLLRWAAPRRARDGQPLRVVVEIKQGRGLAGRVAAVLRREGMEDRAVVISFDHAAVRNLKRLAPRVATGLLFSKDLRGLARRMAWAKADAVFPRHTLIRAALLRQAAQRGWWVGTWTVNEERDMTRLLRLRVHAIASNFPDRLRKKRNALQKS